MSGGGATLGVNTLPNGFSQAAQQEPELPSCGQLSALSRGTWGRGNCFTGVPARVCQECEVGFLLVLHGGAPSGIMPNWVLCSSTGWCGSEAPVLYLVCTHAMRTLGVGRVLRGVRGAFRGSSLADFLGVLCSQSD